MKNQNKLTPLLSKPLFVLVAGIVAMAIMLSASSPILASGGGGGDVPSEAVTLDVEVNTANLPPLEQHWFKFTPGDPNVPADIEKSLTLIFTPNEGNIMNFIALRIFEEDQLPLFFEGDVSEMTVLGQGSGVSRDNNPDTGEFIWSGWVSSQQTYYIQVSNESDFPIDYFLFNDDIQSVSLGDIEPPEAPEADAEEPEEVTDPLIGVDPGNPAPKLPGLNRGTLAPNTTYWYEFKYDDFTGNQSREDIKHSLFVTTGRPVGNDQHYINFELYPYSELNFWERGDADALGNGLTNFGAGALVSRDGDDYTAEYIWNGSVNTNESYLLAIKNGTDREIDYWFYDGDIIRPELGEPTAPAPPRVFEPRRSPQTAEPLKVGLNKDLLCPGEQEWYSFRQTDFDRSTREEVALTMVMTPDDGNRIRRVTFDVFEAGAVQYWNPEDGDNSQINNIGAGSVVYRDTNPQTGERFWQGWVNDNDLYLAQIRNGSDVCIDYYMYTGDVYSPELGEPTQQTVRVPAGPGKEPTVPVDLEVGVNDGQLEPGEEEWYTFTRLDVQPGTQVETAFTLVFLPDDGNRNRKINFELYEESQVRGWAPDNRFNITGFGRGQYVDRDNDVTTGEKIWRGSVLANNRYLIRVTNESDTTIDFRLFTDDVINTSLEDY